MFFRIVSSEGIAHHSYMVGSQGKAAVIDPRRDCGIYQEIADEAGLEITHIFETHRNEDCVAGSRELAAKHGAGIFHGKNLPFRYGTPVRDGDTFGVGSLELTTLETPGHTEESISIVLTDRDASADPYMVFSGDTLFAGDIGRTDFSGRDRDAEMAGKIYDSIVKKILPLGDGVIVCPAHGAGSACGSAIRDHPFTTIGYERGANPYLRMDRDAFVRNRILTTLYMPPYFRHMEECNVRGAPVPPMPEELPLLSVRQVYESIQRGAQILDIRSPASFAAGHIPGSFSIWRDGISAFTGYFLDYVNPIVLVDDFNLDLDPVIRQLLRLGYDNLTGVLRGGFPSWYREAREIAAIPVMSVQQLHAWHQEESPIILDVRDIRNYRSAGFISGAHHFYVGELPQHLDDIPRDSPVVVTCDAGFKSSLAASFLSRNGFLQVTNLLGGMQAWTIAGFPVIKTG